MPIYRCSGKEKCAYCPIGNKRKHFKANASCSFAELRKNKPNSNVKLLFMARNRH
jgi:hypothetical protein